ncbi:bifunctional (p)ppGpp synthetase/guanosine-3',5'-bis(diphosphate) 3'-pyrophosphohydrolase [Acidobacteria bacterium AH-259-G07]|nr:bifunctional (p)ppGpp synthetase/guanosine-3',5'-bis(diphosphate) 3'-pyrophosphohydrolase [Acidobacteria bacterium AH-259-G07]
MIRFEDLEEKVQRYHPNADLELLRKAYVFSAREHKGQVRRSGEPYLFHPLAVASILAEMKLDVACVSVGLLHDIVEDTLTSLDTIREYFGADIAHMVDGVTKISQIQFSSRQEKQAENFRKLLLAMVDDIRVILVKLADRLHNMRTLQYLPPEKRKIIAQETLDIYAPIAHRLGMAKLRGELEDLAFNYLDPVAFQNISVQVEKKRAYSDKFTREVMRAMQQRFEEQGIEANMESRIKRVYSTYQKMKRQRISIDQVYDFIAIRVLANTVRDCYTVLGIVNNMWNPIPRRIKDFIAMPRGNMYQSLHTTVIGHDGSPFELQIRTYDMDRIAEEGIAAHWKYKEGKLEEGKDDKRFQWLRQLLEWQQEVKDPQQFLSNLKIDLYPEEVYTFTPRGEVITLPRGATPVDFAYSIHTEVGHNCVGAKVNGRIVPLKYKLSNGEIVQILTSSDAHPRRDWLNFVNTSRARGAIRRWINLRQKEEAIALGQKLLERTARKYKLNLKKYQDKLQSMLGDFNVSKIEDLFASIGFGKVSSRQVLKRLEPEKLEQEAEESKESKLAKMVNKVFGRSDSAIRVKGYDDLLVYRARCCNPIRGEEIIGYITTGRGISVHSVNCPNVEKLLLNPERKIEVKWTEDGRETTYPVRLLISTEDRTGVLADITSAISSVDTNIVNVNANAVDSRYGLIDMTVEINDAEHLEKIVNYIKAVEGVQEVERAHNKAKR